MSSSASTSSDNTFKFADLNIVHNSEEPRNTLQCVRQAIQLGFDTVAINIDIGELSTELTEQNNEESEPPRKKKKKPNKVKSVPEPYLVDESSLDLSDLEAKSLRFRQYSRLTVTITDSGLVHSLLTNENARKFDILAVRPGSETVFNTVSNKTEFDVLTFDGTESVSWLMKGRLVMQAVDRNVGIELCISAALHDSSTRRQVFANGRQLMRATRGGRGVVLTSGATKPLELRGPYDMANLMTLIGGDTNAGRLAVSGNAKKVLLRADSKRTVKGSLRCQPSVEVLPKQLQMLLKVPEFRAQITVAEPVDSTIVTVK